LEELFKQFLFPPQEVLDSLPNEARKGRVEDLNLALTLLKTSCRHSSEMLETEYGTVICMICKRDLGFKCNHPDHFYCEIDEENPDKLICKWCGRNFLEEDE